MDIGIIGAGNIGATAARLLVRAGHRIAIANSRDPETLAPLVAELGDGARAATVEEAADFGDVVLEAVPFGRLRELPADRLAGKVVIDAANFYPRRDGELDLGGRTHSEVVAEHLRGARVVKAFNTIYFRRLAEGGRPEAPLGERLAIFLASDDEEAKRVVAGLIEEIGFAPVDTGGLREGGRRQEPGSDIYNQPLTGAEAREALARR
jgi:predicted dinucleotide-binding enzyme